MRPCGNLGTLHQMVESYGPRSHKALAASVIWSLTGSGLTVDPCLGLFFFFFGPRCVVHGGLCNLVLPSPDAFWFWKSDYDLHNSPLTFFGPGPLHHANRFVSPFFNFSSHFILLFF